MGVSRRGACRLKRFIGAERPVDGARDRPVRLLANVVSEGVALRKLLATPKVCTDFNV